MKLDYTTCNTCKKRAGACTECSSNPLEHKGEKSMSVLDKRVDEAFGESEKPEIKDERPVQIVYTIGKDGQLIETEQSKRDQLAYEKEKKEEIVEAADDLSLDGQIQEALGKREYDETKYL